MNTYSRLTSTWNHVLAQPGEWALISQEKGEPVLYEKTTNLGLTQDKPTQKWAIGHITSKKEFLPSAGPFSSEQEAISCLIGFAANIRAGQKAHSGNS